MIVEQAFMALPEFLVGAPYLQYDSEATLVMAYAMSVLQELNGRNINNPVAAVRGEVQYPSAVSRRADLHMNLAALGVSTSVLREYGFRDEVWLEAKFFRRNAAGNPRIDGTAATIHLLADLVRLSCLPPESAGQPAQCGRYLLHAYQGNDSHFLKVNKARQSGRAAVAATATTPARPARPNRPAFTRTWVERLTVPGNHTLEGFRTMDEVGGFDKIVGAGLRGLNLKIRVTNLVHAPSSTTNDNFLVVLTRLDEVKVGWGPQQFSVTDATVSEGATGDFAAVQAHVAQNLA